MIDDSVWRSCHLHSWASFHPSVVHSVSKLTRGLRATLAFNISALQEQAQPETLRSSQVQYLKEELLRIPRPFGLLLDYEYAVSAKQMQGWDAVVCEAAGVVGQGVGKPHCASAASSDHAGIAALGAVVARA